MGHGYKEDIGHYHSISENLPELISKYKYSNGYFGDSGKGRSCVRNIVSEDPIATSKDFYDKATRGGIEKEMSNGKGYYRKMKDGSILSYREKSSTDGSPVVEINIKSSNEHGDIKYQKIHFVRGN